jgi:lichenan operon transcriptional antiterminator
MTDKREKLVSYLARSSGWVTAGELADRLGVSTRSVRSYVTAIKSQAVPLEVIESSASGYRILAEGYAAFLARRAHDLVEGTPRRRLYHLAKILGDAAGGTDVHALAQDLFVSESTIEADLRRMRPDVADAGLTIDRNGPRVALRGSERDLRRLLGRMFRGEETQGFLDLEGIEREFASSDLSGFKTGLLATLDRHGYVVNEFGVNNVLLHVAIAVDRITRRRSAGPDAPSGRPERAAGVAGRPAVAGGGPPVSGELADELAALVSDHFGVPLSPDDTEYLTSLLTTRVITRGAAGAAGTVPAMRGPGGETRSVRLVRGIVRRVSEEYLVDLDDEEFIGRLSLHVGNLLARAGDRSSSRNPMSRSLKTTYPMIYELAVFIASVIQAEERIPVSEDEISYIALHVGAHLERQSRREERLSCALVCPNYHDLHVVLRERIEALLGDELQVDVVITRTDVRWDDLSTDLVLTTIGSPVPVPGVVEIHPFLTASDIESIRRAIARARRKRRRARLTDELLVYFDEDFFFRNLHADDETAMIAALGRPLIEAGIIDEGYLEGSVARERLSSTAFTDDLAVPHSLGMTAERTAIGIAVNEVPMDWGGTRVNVVALVAFSAGDRSTFQSVFDQFVSVFSEHDVVQQIVRDSVDFPSFIDGLVRSMDS